MQSKTYITGLGHYNPPKILTNQDLVKFVDTTDEWIVSRTGINSRHVVVDESASDLAAQAAQKAILQAGIDPKELTHVIVATVSADRIIPSASTQLLPKIGLSTGVMAFDINAACSGFIYGLKLASYILAAEKNAKVLIAPVEILTSRTNWEDRSTCVLFGDGAGAAILESAPRGEHSILVNDSLCDSDGSSADLLTCAGGGSAAPYKLGHVIDESHFITMNGREIFKHAVRNMTNICKKLLEDNHYSIEDMDVIIPHQANLRIIEAVGERLNVNPKKVYINVHRHGNTSAASIPIALGEALSEGFIKKGDKVLITSFGAGLTWGASILTF